MVSEIGHQFRAAGDDAGDEPPSWDELKRRRQTRVRLIVGIVVLVAIAAGVAALVANAAAHYERGRVAMDERHFGMAVEEFSAARILAVPYRDAEALADKAQLELELAAARVDVKRQQRAAIARLLREAAAGVDSRDVAAVLAALHEARIIVPDGPLAATSGQAAMATDLAASLTAAGKKAMEEGLWKQAGLYGSALLILDPSATDGSRLSDRAKKATGLQRELDAARAAARQGSWRKALRLARNVLREWPGFPGAAAVVTRARAALAPKPTPTPTPTQAPAPVVTTAPPPPVAPQPTAPPPP